MDPPAAMIVGSMSTAASVSDIYRAMFLRCVGTKAEEVAARKANAKERDFIIADLVGGGERDGKFIL